MGQAATFAVDWNAIDTVLVDMDGTLLDLAFDNYFWLDLVPEHYARKHGLTVAESRAALAPRFAAKVGTLDWYCLDHWTRDLGLDLKIAEARASRAHSVPAGRARVPRRGSRADASDSASSPMRTAIRSRSRPSTPGIDRLVDGVVCSHDFAAPKESADFWRALERHEPFDGARTLLIEDSLAVLAAARSHGVQHTVAIRRPDSRQPPRAIAGFAAIDGVADLI